MNEKIQTRLAEVKKKNERNQVVCNGKTEQF